MDEVKLLNRIDTKFVLSINQFPNLLQRLAKHYKILEIKGKRTARYQSLYFDTADYKYYLDHHNGRVDRHKVRIRKYLDSDLCFFEIKHKYKGRTDKRRISIDDFQQELEPDTLAFLNNTIVNAPKLRPSLWNNFERITLVNNERMERMTLDIGLNFSWEGKQFGYNDIIIAEVKQEFDNRQSPCRNILHEEQIRAVRVSKYCIGMGLLYEDLKRNNFKKKYRIIEKIQQYA